MLWLSEHISRISELMAQGSSESLTHAALRCRIAIELVCYDRLRNAHDYISADDLRRWQPRDVVNKLIQDVDPYIATSYTISVSKTAVPSDAPDLTLSDYDQLEYVEIGSQAGFDTRRLGKTWNSLGSFLHVRLPQSREDELATFSAPELIERKLEEALALLREIEQGTMVSSGFGKTVKFECNCGSENKRRAELLTAEQTINCINPECAERWIVRIEGDDIGFERCSIPVTCKCGETTLLTEKVALELERNQRLRFQCRSCDAENIVMWKLMHGPQ